MFLFSSALITAVAAVPDDPKAAAADLLAKMTLDEKVSCCQHKGRRGKKELGGSRNVPPTPVLIKDSKNM